MQCSRLTILTVAIVSASGCQQTIVGAAKPSSKPPSNLGPGEQNVVLTSSGKSRRGTFHIEFDKDGQPKFEEPKDVSLLAGTVTVDSKTFRLYIPNTGPYRVKNSGGASHLENNSTIITVDSNGDDVLDRSENWFADRPVRLGNQMFEVKSIASDGSWLQLSTTKKPLGGVVVGWPAPNFSFKTMEGKTVSLSAYKGKALLLDVWSMT
jgi:hypothetical protein